MDTDEPEDILEDIKKMSLNDKQQEEKKQYEKRSDDWDEKVKRKQKRNDEEALLYAEHRRKEEENKRKKEKEDSCAQKQEKKKAKTNSHSSKEIYTVNGNIVVEEIDERYHHLVGPNNMKFPGPMNGNCQGASKASVLFSDPSQGPALSAQENKYLVDHWEYFKDSITFPHSIKVKGGNDVVFNDEKSFIEFLVENPESSFMWGDHQQLQITANRYNVKINVLTIDSKGNGTIFKEPFKPDPRLRQYALLEAELTEMQDMWLLYTNGNHFDALIRKDHPLITVGIVKDHTQGENVKKKTPQTDYDMSETQSKEKTNNDAKDKKIKELEKLLKQSEQGKSKIEVMYKDCEEQVKILQEEKDRLNIDVKDLKEYINKKENSTTNKGDDTNKEKSDDKKKVCKFIWKEKVETYANKCKKSARIPNEIKEIMHNCDQCDFQSTTSTTLSKHMNMKHRTAQQETDDVFRCNDCNMQFSAKWNLMNHRKENHEITEICEYFLKGSCSFTETKCWNLHTKPQNVTLLPGAKTKDKEEVECFVCKQKFRTRKGMMMHRKQFHLEMVPECKEYVSNTCGFTNKTCWYKHTETVDFQEATENLAPPS